jgi:PKD repeat protein
MRHILLPALLCLSSIAVAQVPMERVYTMPGALDIHGVAVDPEGHYVIASVDNDDIQVTRISPTGVHEWTNVYPYFTEEGLYWNSIAAGPDGILVAGFTMGTGTMSRDGILVHLDLEGNLLDAQRINAGGSNAFHTLKAISDGFIATGRSDLAGNGYDFQLTKLNSVGQIQWSRTYGGPEWDWAYEATELADGGFAMVGYGDNLGTGFSPSGYMVRTDALGNELWARTISSGAGVDETYCVIQNSDGDFYVGGRSLGYVIGDVSAYITKISSTGNHLWTRYLPHGIETMSLAQAANGGVTWLAHPQWNPGGTGDYEMAWGTFSTDGTLVGSKIFGGAGSDNPIQLIKKDDGSYVIIGFSSSYGSGPNDWQGLFIQTDPDGNAGCDPLDSAIVWSSATAIVTPFTSLTGSDFTSYPQILGQTPVDVGTYDPCCSVIADFTASSDGTGGFFWTFSNSSSGAQSYSWDFGDGTSSTEESPGHTYPQNGSYTVCLTATGECNGQPTTATNCETISISVGVADLNGAAAAIRLYPSPAMDAFVVESHLPIASIRLVDSKGSLVLDSPVDGGMHAFVPVADIPAGAYIARVLLSDGSLHHLRVMVAH